VEQPEPMIKGVKIEYQVAARTRAIGYGGIGALHTMVCKLGLDKAINGSLQLLQALDRCAYAWFPSCFV